MSVGIRPILWTVVLVSNLVFVVSERPHLIRFFTQTDCRAGTVVPRYFEYLETKNVSSEVGNLLLQSYCVHRGAWRVEFTVPRSSYDFNISMGDGCAQCINKGSNNWRYGMVRRIGGRDITQAHITLYPQTDFLGREVFINGWEFTFNDTYSFGSLAFTGFNNWTWQLYYLPRFRGSSVCYRPKYETEMTLINPMVENVGSVRLGCRNSGKSRHGQEIGIIIITIMAFALPTATILL